MNSELIFDLIEEIANTSSKNDKLAIIKRNIDDLTFQKVLSYSYSPFKTFGVRQMPIGKAHDGYKDGFDNKTWEILDCLADRRLTGLNATQVIAAEIDALPSKSAELFRRILRKNLRAGFSESTINKARKGLVKEFPYMRCSLPKDTDLSKWPWGRGVFVQEKADGMFANVDNEESGIVSIRSRQGTEFPMDKFEAVADEIRTTLTAGRQYHGEFLVMRDGVVLPRQEGNGIMNSVLNGGDFAPNEWPIYKIWDAVPLECVVPKGKCEVPYSERFGGIELDFAGSIAVALKHIDIIPTKIVKSLAEAKEFAAKQMKEGKEGAVVKHPDAPWTDSTSKFQVKIKLEFECDLEIVAVVPGSAGTKNEGRAGSLTCKTNDDALEVDVAVKNEAMRDSVDAHPDQWIGGIMTVVANDIMFPSESNMNHSLFLPRFIEDCLRDKSRADELPRVFEAKRAAIYGEELMREVV